MSEIVVGVDGSEAAHRALAWALDESRRRDAALIVVHAYQPPESRHVNAAAHSYLPAGALERVAEQERLERVEQDAIARHRAEGLIRRSLEAAGADRHEGVVKNVIVARDAARTLVEMSRASDLLVVGSRGRGGFKGLLVGSVSQQCIHHAYCPVVVVR